MSEVAETPAPEIESTELVPVCAHCGDEIMRVRNDIHVSTDGTRHPYVIVSGTYIVAIDSNGDETGSRWGFCLPCVESGRTTLPTAYLEDSCPS